MTAFVCPVFTDVPQRQGRSDTTRRVREPCS